MIYFKYAIRTWKYSYFGGILMKEILKKCPIPIAGLMLGLAAAGNLLKSSSNACHSTFGIISAIILILLLAKIAIYPKETYDNLNNSLIASVAPTFSMSLMLLATYLKPYTVFIARLIWIIGLIMHIILIIWFTKKYVVSFNIKQVFPSWFIVYVGIAVSSVTGPAFALNRVGQYAFWFGFISYIVLLPIVMYRAIKIKEIPEQALPTLAIFAAPASLLLAGYINSFELKNIVIFGILMTLSLIMYVLVIIMLFKLLRLKFYPSYACFTFPLIISCTAIKGANSLLSNLGQNILILKYFTAFQEILGVIITLYVLIRYIEFLLPVKNPNK